MVFSYKCHFLMKILSSESCYCDETPGLSLGSSKRVSSLGEAICDSVFIQYLEHQT